MKISLWIAGGLLAAFSLLKGTAQSLVSAGAGAAHGAQAIASVSERIIRQIRDPHTGTHWVVVRNPQNPSGPGRAVAATEAAGKADQETAAVIVIHPGDRLVVEEHTSAMDGTLEAVALGTAAAGCGLEARLKIGGKVVRVVALAPGRAAIAPSGEARP